MARILFITGTDTGVGKTYFSAVAVHVLRERGVNVAGLKPVCAGSRDDARVLQKISRAGLTLDEVNPWHFRAALAPVLAARAEKKRARVREVVAHIRRVAKRFDTVVVEGAGGLLSPLGEDFNSRDLLVALDAQPIIVCPNRLGTVGQVLLVLAALPKDFAARAGVVLVKQAKPDRASHTNKALLAEKIGTGKIYELPWLKSRKAK
ncbi:MAG: dethiobiotin synthase [Verrucomicrobiota bacterium]